jgi:hypothetical protein
MHRSMLLWKHRRSAASSSRTRRAGSLGRWAVLEAPQALFEVLPHDLGDWKLVNAPLDERPTLQAEAKRTAVVDREPTLFDRGR